MTSVAIVGATGFLGQAAVGAFAADGYETHAVVRTTSDTSAIEHSLASPPARHDGTPDHMHQLFADMRPDSVVLLAAVYVREHTPADIAELVTTNIGLCTIVADAAAAAGSRVLVHAGSAFQHYESSGYRPLNLYAASKQACEAMLAYYEDATALCVVRLRFTDTYGPGDARGKLVDAIAAAQRTGDPLALPDKPTRIDLVHVEDAARAVVAAVRLGLTAPNLAAGPYSVTSGTPLPLADVVAAWEEASGEPVPTEPGAYTAPERHPGTPWVGDPVPGWEPQIDLVTGFRTLLDA